MLTAKQLHGETVEVAELMGKPHWMCRYERESYTSHQLLIAARCVVCGVGADDAHHVVPRGHTHGFTVNTKLGKFVCLSPLFAVCRTCHDRFPSGYKLEQPRYFVTWEWDKEQYQEEWWSGHTLAHVCRPHSPFLWQQGHYVLTDKQTGEQREIRGGYGLG